MVVHQNVGRKQLAPALGPPLPIETPHYEDPCRRVMVALGGRPRPDHVRMEEIDQRRRVRDPMHAFRVAPSPRSPSLPALAHPFVQDLFRQVANSVMVRCSMRSNGRAQRALKRFVARLAMFSERLRSASRVRRDAIPRAAARAGACCGSPAVRLRVHRARRWQRPHVRAHGMLAVAEAAGHGNGVDLRERIAEPLLRVPEMRRAATAAHDECSWKHGGADSRELSTRGE